MHTIFIILVLFHCLVATRVTAVDSFATEFYQTCAEQSPNQNIVISPFSVSTALALLSQGAKHNTFRQIVQGVRLPNDKSVIASVFAEHFQTFNKTVGKATLSIINQIYVSHSISLKQSFKDVAVNSFKSGVESLDFTDVKLAASKINKFVEDKTNGKIKDLVSELQPDTSIVLVNAIHFKANWLKQFDKRQTRKDQFLADGKYPKAVDFMHTKQYFRYAEIDDLDARAIELKYDNSNISFVVILPNNPSYDLESSLTNYDLGKMTSQLQLAYVKLTLPKFKFEYRITLNEVLEKMGMIDMFYDNADFSDQVDVREMPVPIRVSKVEHQAFIDVDENGTEAAAATAIREMPYSNGERQVDEVFEANRPFLFYIVDFERNIVLFNGRYKG